MISIHEHINIIFGYLHGLWRYRWSALLISWIVALGGWLYVYSLPDIYQSEAAIHLDTTSVMQPLLKGLAVDVSPEEELNVMSRILLSRENLLNVMRETDMDLEADTPVAREAIVGELYNNIRIGGLGSKRGKPTTIFQISYQSTSAEQSFKVVFNLLNTLIENTLNSSRLDTAKAEEFLDEQIQDYEKRLINAEERLAEFQKKNVGFMPNEKGGYYARVRDQQRQIDSTKSKLRAAKQRYAEIRQQLSGEKQILGASPTIKKLIKLQEELDNLLLQYTDEHPDVQTIRAKIAELKASKDSGIESYPSLTGPDAELNPIYQDLKVEESRARVQIGMLQVELSENRKKMEELELSIDIIPQVEADLARLNRDYDITRERYLRLVERRESAIMAQKVEENSSELLFRVVDAPIVPLTPIGPDREMYLAGVFLAALAMGFGWTIFRFLLHPTFIDFKQMRKMIDLPVLGSITLQMSPEIRGQRRLHLTTFLVTILLMCASLVAAILYSQQGSVQVRMLMSSFGI